MKPFALAATLTLLAPAAMAEAPLLVTQMYDLAITPLAELPAAPVRTQDRQFCRHLFVDAPATAAGQATSAKGWEVTREEPFGPYTAVSFIGGFEPATSGTCELVQGNVGIWSGSQLVALVYSQNPDDELIGSIIPFGQGLRIYSGGVIPGTVADLRLVGGTDIAVTPPALAESVCDGRAEVPFIEGMPINMARKALMESGWQPVPQPVSEFGLTGDLVAAGVPEAEDCAGTGFAFCSYAYEGPAGGLTVITAGEVWDGVLPSVTGYSKNCTSP